MSDVALVQQLVTRYEALRQEIKKVIFINEKTAYFHYYWGC